MGIPTNRKEKKMENNLIATSRPIAKWSAMSGKMKDIPALNTSPLNNSFCVGMHESKNESICSHCYSVKALKGYRKNCDDRFRENGDVLTSGPVQVRDVETLPPVRIARFSGHGELHDAQHLKNLYQIAEWYPETTFALWTKRNSIVRMVGIERLEQGLWPCPDNVVLVYSNGNIDQIDDTPPPGFHKVFNNTSTLTAADNCTGKKCAQCLNCYSRKGPVSIVEKIKH